MHSVIKLAVIPLMLLGLAHSADAQTGPWSTQGPSNCSDQFGNFDAFIPGMRGSGACNRGGFVPGTNVIVVTNRNDSGSGSLREAVQAACPKVILFGVAGVITNNNILITRDCDNWSIVGSSAPGNVTIYGSSSLQMTVFGSNWTIGHLTIPSSVQDDAIGFGRWPKPSPVQSNMIIYNTSFMWAPYAGGSGSSNVECYPEDNEDNSSILFWQDIFMAAAGAIGHHLMNNTCQNVNTIRTMYMDSLARTPLSRVDGYVHANNVHINMQQEFVNIQPCAGGVVGPQGNPFQNSFLNNYFAHGPRSNASALDFIEINSSTSCTTVQIWEEGTAGMVNFPNQQIRDCSNHACTGGMSGVMQSSPIAAIHPTGYVPESIVNTVQGHTDFVTQIGTFAGARPADRFTYVQDRINQSINAVDGVGPVSPWNGWGSGGSGATVASEGGSSQVFDTPQSGYDPRSAAQNPCGVAMPTGSAADDIRTSGLTRLHEWAIGCFMDNVMPAGYREDSLQDFPAPGGGGLGPPPTRPNPPVIE